MVRIIIGVTGTATFLFRRGERVELLPQQAIFLEADTNVTTSNTELWARCEWHLILPDARRAPSRNQLATPLDLPSAHYALATSVTNILSTQKKAGQWGNLEDVLTGTARAALMDGSAESRRSTNMSAILERANEVIESRYVDPAFGPDALAEELHITARYLRRCFASSGTSPSRAIEDRRIAAVEAYMSLVPLRGRALEKAAVLSGFSSVRRLRSALDRQAQRKGL